MTKFFTATPAKVKLSHNQDNEIYAIFSFDTPEVSNDSRPPLDIAVAMDTSSSMSGERLLNAKRSLRKLIEHMTDRDRLAVVSFNSAVTAVLEPTFMTREAKTNAIKAIEGMRARACTNLSGGVLRALQFLQTNPLEGAVQKCMLFTDGQANEGIFETEALTNAINGNRKGIAISSFGYGHGYDENILNAVSQGGSLYYMDTPDTILTAFGTELGGLISTYAQNVTVTLTPAEGVEILEILNDFDVTNNGQSAVITLDDLLAEQQFHVVTLLRTTERDLTDQEVKLVTAEVRYFNTVTGDNSSEIALLKTQFVTPDSATSVDNPAVMNEVAIEKLIQVQIRATVFAKSGDYESAQGLFISNSAWMESAEISEGLQSLNDGMSTQYASRGVYGAIGGKLGSTVARSLKSRKPMDLASHAVTIGADLDDMFGTSSTKTVAASFEMEDTATDTIETTDSTTAVVESFVKSRHNSKW